MWQDRLKGLVVVFVFALLIFLGARYFVQKKPMIGASKATFKPLDLEKKVLGAILKWGKNPPASSSGDLVSFQEEISSPVLRIEKKMKDLLGEIKGLPQEQVSIVKKRLLKEVCEPLEETNLKEASSSKSEVKDD
ncbi:hypothetical protein ACFLZP_03325 [Patescibacteria group bacterium]